MSGNSDPSNSRQPGSAFDLFSNNSYRAVARQLDAKPEAWIATDELIAAIIGNSKQPIPEVVLDHLRLRLDGEAKKPRGRKKSGTTDPLRRLLIPIAYQRYLRWLQRRQAAHGLKGWSCIRDAGWWTGSPHERAARMTQARLMKQADWRHILNVVTKANS